MTARHDESCRKAETRAPRSGDGEPLNPDGNDAKPPAVREDLDEAVERCVGRLGLFQAFLVAVNFFSGATMAPGELAHVGVELGA